MTRAEFVFNNSENKSYKYIYFQGNKMWCLGFYDSVNFVEVFIYNIASEMPKISAANKYHGPFYFFNCMIPEPEQILYDVTQLDNFWTSKLKKITQIMHSKWNKCESNTNIQTANKNSLLPVALDVCVLIYLCIITDGFKKAARSRCMIMGIKREVEGGATLFFL
jgi:hypothetical protein